MAVATPCLQFPHSPTTTKNLNLSDGVLFFRSTFLGTTSCSMLYRTRSYELLSKHRRNPSTRRVYSGSFDNSLSFENEEFSKKIEELGFNFQISSQTNFSLSDEEEEINDVVDDDDDDDDDEEEDEEEDDEDALRRIVNQDGLGGIKILGMKKKESKHRNSQQ